MILWKGCALDDSVGNGFSLQMIQMESSILFKRVVTENWSTSRNDLMIGVCARWLSWKWFFFTNDPNGKLHSVPTGSNRKLEYLKKWSYERGVRSMTRLEMIFLYKWSKWKATFCSNGWVTENWSTTRNDLMKGVCTRWLGWKLFFFTNDPNGKFDTVPTGRNRKMEYHKRWFVYLGKFPLEWFMPFVIPTSQTQKCG